MKFDYSMLPCTTREILTFVGITSSKGNEARTVKRLAKHYGWQITYVHGGRWVKT